MHLIGNKIAHRLRITVIRNPQLVFFNVHFYLMFFCSFRYDQHQDRLKDRNSLDSNGSSILRQTNNRFRRDERQMDEDEELWFNDDECDEENPDNGVTSGAGEPDKSVANCEKTDKIEMNVGDNVLPTIDNVMEEDKKKELMKGVDLDPAVTAGQTVLNGAKKSMALVDYNDSDSDGEGI